jgi:hypothetical protein
MSYPTFQILVTVATALAVLALLAQGVVAFLMLGVYRELKERAAPLTGRVKRLMAIEQSDVQRIEAIVDRTTKTLHCGDLCMCRVNDLKAHLKLLKEPLGRAKDRTMESVHSVSGLVKTGREVAREMSPHVAELKCEGTNLYRTAHMQGRRAIRDARHIFRHFTHMREVVVHR